MMARALLPGLGGSYAVWGVSMIFFQGMLVVGYLWAHLLQRKLGVVRYSHWHCLLLLTPFLFFPFNLADFPSATRDLPLFVEVIRLLFITVGLPFLVLSTTSLILQRWLAIGDLEERKNPYVLYSASNLGSIGGLLAYPILVEPLLTLRAQENLWWALYAVLVALQIACMPFGKKSGEDEGEALELEAASGDGGEQSAATGVAFSWRLAATWVLLSASGSALLLSVTNTLVFDVASVPFLWVLPLCVYLATFVLLFKRRMWCPRWIKGAFNWIIVFGVVLHFLALARYVLPVGLLLLLQLGVLFALCMRCHGLLVARRPADPRHLTTFYVAMSLGGVLGSLLIGGLAPAISNSVVEYPGAFLLAAIAVALAGRGGRSGEEGEAATADGASRPSRYALPFSVLAMTLTLTLLPWLLRLLLPWLLRLLNRLPDREIVVQDNREIVDKIVLVAVLLPTLLILRGANKRPWRLAAVLGVVMVLTGVSEAMMFGGDLLKRHRNFYGIYRVFDRDGVRCLQHGITIHGRQHVSGEFHDIPMSYHHPSTPAGNIMENPPIEIPRVAMVGLGAGALAYYLQPGQKMTVYELDRDNLPIADEYFDYLEKARQRGVDLNFAFGDGRILLSKQPENSYDLLVLDAFSSGALPVHLLTKEAVDGYFKVLRPGGLLLMNISNKYVDLEPVVGDIAQELGLRSLTKTNSANVHKDADLTLWAALCQEDALADELVKDYNWRPSRKNVKGKDKPWTDHYNNLFWLVVKGRGSWD